ncbi:putative defective integrase; Qin prophage [Magnetospirillum sp. XM-1]|uniref:tyrosine-type recombinase/integrase n=1 Tax=Magnetospirillum sp. XM-1 TaxID=1663591 RepID=UPI00073DD83A|nr:tyrosine-type recombinase/integrase [Magnetospirillum sp. XM-1]CUW37512.1 putative defective integrase; Qin prophage [Magnetospirillum sp. XM-1]
MGKFERDGFSIKGGAIRLYRRGDSKSEIWHASVTRPDRKVDRFSTKTPDPVEAGRVAERHFDRLRFAEEFGIPLDQKNFKQVSDHWYAEVLGKSICDKNKSDFRAILDRYLVPFFGQKSVSLIKLKDIAEYRKWRISYWTDGPGKDITHIVYQRGDRTFKRPVKRCIPSAATLAREDVVLRGVLQSALSMGYANNHEILQFKSVRPDGKSRGALSREQYQKLVAASWERSMLVPNGQTLYYRQLLAVYIQFLVMTGLRPGEARRLRFMDIKDGYVVLQESKTKVRKVVGVAGFSGIISFLHDVHQALYGRDVSDEEENPFPRPTDYLWRDYQKDEPIHDFKRSFNELLAYCGITHDEHQNGKITIYSLRHTYAHFRIVYGGVNDVYLLAQNMGTSVQMIEKYYGHLEPLHRKDELKRVHRNSASDKLMDNINDLFGLPPFEL